MLTSFCFYFFQVSSSLIMISTYLAVVTYVNIFHMNCYQGVVDVLHLFMCIAWLVVIVIEILILLFFHRYCFTWTFYLLRNRYARYVQKLCKHGVYKNYEEYCYLVLEEEVCFVLLGLLWGFPFFDNWCFLCSLP